MKTYAVKLKCDTKVEGIDCDAGTHMGALTSECGPLTLLGLVQHHHAVLEEIVDCPDDCDDGCDGDCNDGDAGDGTAIVGPTDVSIDGDQPGDESGDSQSDDSQPRNDQPNDDTSIASFLAAGLDQKTAEALVVSNKIGSIDELKLLMSDPKFDLIDLEEIGTARAEKIKAVFSAE